MWRFVLPPSESRGGVRVVDEAFRSYRLDSVAWDEDDAMADAGGAPGEGGGSSADGSVTVEAAFAAAQATNPEVRGAWVLPGTARTLVQLDTTEGERWWVLDGTVIVSMATVPAWDDLLADLHVPWESFARGPGVPFGETAPLSDEAREALARRVAEVMKPRIEAFVAAALAGRASNT